MSKLIETRAEFQQLAEERLEEAKALLSLGKWGGAYYLAGYAVELALKACIIKRIMATDAFPEKEFSRNCYTHDLDKCRKRSISMGHDALVMDELESGRKLIERLINEGLDIRLAFWLKRTEAEKWSLYLVSPRAYEMGDSNVYRFIIPIVKSMPELGMEAFSIKVVGLEDSKATAAWKIINPRGQASSFENKRVYPRITRISGSTFAGTSIEGGYIYPPPQSAVST